MKEIRSVAILGAGAIGAYFIFGLSTKPDLDLCVIATGKRATRLKQEGIIINNIQYFPVVKTPSEARGADLLLISTKYDGLLKALPDIAEIVTENTMVMSLLNGINSEEIIAKVIPEKQIIYSLMRINSERRGNSVHFAAETTPGLFVGEKNSSEKSERVCAVEALLDNTPLHFNFVPDIISDQWLKYALNVSYNLPQAILDVGLGAYFDSTHVEAIRLHLDNEVRTVAKAYGIDYGTVHINRNDWSPAARFSTLQDLDSKNHTEIDMFAGILIEKAHAKNIDVPFTEFAYHAIRALEEKNDGRFSY